MKKTILLTIFSFMLCMPVVNAAEICGKYINHISSDDNNVLWVKIDDDHYSITKSVNQASLAEKAYMLKLPVCYEYYIPWGSNPYEITNLALYTQ